MSNAKLFGVAGESQTSKIRDAPQTSNRSQRALQPLNGPGNSLTLGEPSAKFGTTEKIYREEEETNSQQTQKSIGQDGAVPLPLVHV